MPSAGSECDQAVRPVHANLDLRMGLVPFPKFARRDRSPIQHEHFQLLEGGHFLQVFASELLTRELDRLDAAKEKNLLAVHHLPPPLQAC